ncbi:hypothetical protein KAFR_0B05960 [Kazachstania africana CBS 2517]|uniref:Hyaluronan/mRNA-binding protein domain-containing protein n=1 Tax=Kazachstania africana (strain ATCC 22294 / BCRC 22015 / CBS 2517 / CECT 1963 / NBRC 1671 / NRRL Y-8276) TaxID=1071382 RepID=H2AR92_KAZAF|nr:hypothetical protein KAFR_0B05960 [Kazachstania africana CBS 2517]CCF56892.1 hypothetical protein KAFR_0B05960 [Kazachstania africana CBS 2517]
MSNPFDLLGNDVEDPSVVVPAPKELVKKSTSSKKADVPPPSANPAKANKNRPRPSGNEGAIRDKTAGRQKNRSKDVPASATTKRSNVRRQSDKHSRTGKTDSNKKVSQGWGDDKKELETENAAEQDAEAEIAEEEQETEDASKKMTLEAYLQSQGASDLNKTVEPQNLNKLENAELFVKEQEVYVPATKVKSVKSKQLKTKQFLDFDATFSDSLPKQKRTNVKGPRKNNNQNRTPRRFNKASNGNAVQKDNTIDTANLPSLA